MLESVRNVNGNEGAKTFSDPQNRSFVSASIWNDVNSLEIFSIHDPIHNLARKLSAEWILNSQVIKQNTNKPLEEIDLEYVLSILNNDKEEEVMCACAQKC